MRGLQKRAYMSTSRAHASQRNEANRGSGRNIGGATSPRKKKPSGGMSNTSKAALGAGALGLGVGGLLGYSKKNRRSQATEKRLRDKNQELANQVMDLTSNTSGAKGSLNTDVGGLWHSMKSMGGWETYD